MSVIFAIPSKKLAKDAQKYLNEWKQRGYLTAVWRDYGDEDVECDLMKVGTYQGYAASVNALCKDILELYPEVQWIVTGGDDYLPDSSRTPEQIALECYAHFNGTFGVMQPTGDRWGENPNYPDPRYRGAYIDRVAGSPWLGADFCRRMYGGTGPYWPGYFHMFEDEELQEVATKLGVFWQRRDLTQFHDHWGRQKDPKMPWYLAKGNAAFEDTKRVFLQRKAAGFPGHEPISL